MRQFLRVTALAVLLALALGPGAPLAAQAEQGKVYTGIFGLWAYRPWDEGLALARKNGFDLVVIEASRSRLDQVQAQGLKAIVAFDLFKGTVEDPVQWRGYLDNLRAKVTALKGHPAVLAWYPVDEPDHRGVPEHAVREAVALVRSLDPSRPVFGVLNDPDKWLRYLPIFDIVSVDPYLLVGSRDTPEKVRTYLRRIRADLAGLKIQKPVWVTVGAFEMIPKSEADRQYDWYQRVTAAQFDAMADIAIAEGAQGILVFALAHRGDAHYKDWSMPGDSPRLWDAVRRLPARVRR